MKVQVFEFILYSTYSNVPNKRACTFISGKVCLLGSIKVRLEYKFSIIWTRVIWTLKEFFKTSQSFNQNSKKIIYQMLKFPTKLTYYKDYLPIYHHFLEFFKIDHSITIRNFLEGFFELSHLGAKYLVFVSSCSVKMRELSFAQFIYFWGKVCLFFNFWMIKFTITVFPHIVSSLE